MSVAGHSAGASVGVHRRPDRSSSTDLGAHCCSDHGVQQEHLSRGTVEQIIDLPVPQVMELRDVPSTRLSQQTDDVFRVTPPEGVADERVSADHVERAVSWFDQKEVQGGSAGGAFVP